MDRRVSSVPACAQVVSTGNAAVGVDIVTDPSCANGGLGCIDSICRFCKNRDTAQSGHYLSCQSINPAYGSVKNPASPPAPTPAPKPTTGVPVSTSAPAAPVTLSPSSPSLSANTNPVVVVATPTPTTAPPSTPPPASTTVSSGGTTVQTPPADFCSDALITNALRASGVWAVFDPSCPRDGDLGDCNEYCRMCQFIDTSASTKLRSCSGVLATAAAADSGVWSPSDLALPDTPPASQCASTLAQDTVNSGIWITFTCLTVDPSGQCLQAKCDYCKYFETPVSSAYPPCDALVSIVDSEVSVQATASSRELRIIKSSGSDDGEGDKVASANAEGYAAIGAVVVLVAVAAVGVARTVRNFHESFGAEELP